MSRAASRAAGAAAAAGPGRAPAQALAPRGPPPPPRAPARARLRRAATAAAPTARPRAGRESQRKLRAAPYRCAQSWEYGGLPALSERAAPMTCLIWTRSPPSVPPARGEGSDLRWPAPPPLICLPNPLSRLTVLFPIRSLSPLPWLHPFGSVFPRPSLIPSPSPLGQPLAQAPSHQTQSAHFPSHSSLNRHPFGSMPITNPSIQSTLWAPSPSYFSQLSPVPSFSPSTPPSPSNPSWGRDESRPEPTCQPSAS